MTGSAGSDDNVDDKNDLVNNLDVFVEKDLKTCLDLIGQLSSVDETSDGTVGYKVERICEQFETLINKWQTTPKLVESHLSELFAPIIEIVTSSTLNGHKFNASFQLIQRLVACVGQKSVLRFFPTEITWVLKVLDWSEKQKPNESKSWQTRHILLLWLSMAVKTPFHLRKFDSDDGIKTSERIYTLIDIYLKVSDKGRDSAALLAANMLSRPDIIEEQYLNRFMNESLEHLNEHFGYVIAVAILFKIAKRSDINTFADRVIEIGTKLDTKEHELMSKWKLKLIGRCALSLMSPRIAKWRYQRGRRLLSQNISLQVVDEKGDSKSLAQGNTIDDMEDDSDYSDIPDQLEVIIDSLLNGLHDPNTIVRWSAAKYVARVTNRLPKELANDVVSHILQQCERKGSDSSWHGSCLALAELARRGLILSDQLPQIINMAEKALIFDQLKGTFSVGANVRDAACFVCWSLSRAYESQEIEPYVHQLAPTLVCVTCFDREVNCRRAASAAIQEMAGRTQVFPHGLEVLILTDFHLLANRNHCYLDIALKLAEKPEFGQSLVQYLVNKCDHWDRDLREIIAKALGRLSTIIDVNPYMNDLLSKTISMDLNARHGSILSIAHIIGNIGDKVDQQYIRQIERIAQTLSEKKLLRGIGGEFMKNAISVLIENCSSVRLPISREVFAFWSDILCDSITSEDVRTREKAIAAVPQFCFAYLKNEENLKQKVLEQLLQHLNSTKESARIGSAESLRLMSPELLNNDFFNNCFDSMVSHISSNDLMCFSRASEVSALVELSAKFMPIEESKHKSIVDCLCLALDDRTSDQRGDIGGNVRLAAVEASLQYISHCNNEEAIRIVKLMATQCVSNWQKERRLASNAFKQIVLNNDLKIFERQVFVDVFENEAEEGKPFVQLLNFQPLTYDLWRGLVKSVSNPTETRVRNLVKQELRTAKPYVLEEFLNLFEANATNELLSQNLAKCCHYLLSSCRTSPQFCNKAMSLCWNAIRKSRDAHKLMAAIDVFCTGLQLSSFKEAMSYLVLLLCHVYPRVRCQAANQIYIALLTAEDVNEEGLSLLTDTDWTQPLAQLRPIRDKFCDLLSIAKPKRVTPESK